jgi:hypothetical protein
MAERRRYPAGRNLVSSWEALEETGRGVIDVPGSHEPVRVEWRAYRNPDGSYSSSYYGTQYLAVFSRRGRRLRVTESYTHTSVTNSGRHVARFRYTSTDGVCATEIVKALADGGRLVLEKVKSGGEQGSWRLHAEQSRDFTFHEIDVEYFRCEAFFDLRRCTALVKRSRFRDSSQ